MSDSPKPGLQWYWGGGSGSSRVSSPAPTPRDHEDTTATAGAALVRSREDNDAAELVLEQLDEQWFCDNVVRWPSSRPGSPPGVIDKDIIASPFRRPPPSGLSSTTQSEFVTKPRPWVGDRGSLNPPRSRHHEIRRLSDGDHHLRRYLERDHHTPRRRILVEPEDHRRNTDIPNSSSSSLPQTPTNLESTTEQTRFCSEAITMEDVFSPLALPPSGPLMGVTEDEELENDLFAKMLANRPAKLMTINPGRFAARGPLQENTNTGSELQTGKKPRQRRRLKGTKSLTDLEYEELRGLKDLGFEVSKDDLTPHVVRMFPGLQRQGIPPYNSPQGSHSNSQQPGNVVSQSRFPAVQHLLWPRRPDSPLTNAPFLDPSIDMKGQLKSWASEMASIVSIEC